MTLKVTVLLCFIMAVSISSIYCQEKKVIDKQEGKVDEGFKGYLEKLESKKEEKEELKKEKEEAKEELKKDHQQEEKDELKKEKEEPKEEEKKELKTEEKQEEEFYDEKEGHGDGGGEEEDEEEHDKDEEGYMFFKEFTEGFDHEQLDDTHSHSQPHFFYSAR